MNNKIESKRPEPVYCNNELLTKQELMEKLKIKSLKPINDWIAEGMPRHKFNRLIRFRLDEVIEWFKERERIKLTKEAEADEGGSEIK